MRGREVIAAIALALGVFLLFGLLGGGMMFWPGVMHYGYGFGYGYRFIPLFGIGALLFRTLILATALILFVSLLRRRHLAAAGSAAGATRPIDIARERYARGEITKEQFDQMRRDLEER